MRIAAVSDLHLGYRAGSARTDEGRNLREQDIYDAWEKVVDGIVEADVDLVTVAGDVFDSPAPPVAAIRAWITGLTRLQPKRRPVVVVQGNHDAAKTAGAVTPLLAHSWSGAHLVTRYDDQLLGTRLGPVYVSSFPYEHGEYRIVDPGIALADQPRVAVIHGAIDHPSLPSYYAAGGVPFKWLADRFDVICAGDYHSFHRFGDHPMAFYSGAIERTTTNPWSEHGPFGWVLVDTDAKTVEHQPIDVRTAICHSTELRRDGVRDGARALNSVVKRFARHVREKRGHYPGCMLRISMYPWTTDQNALVDWKQVRELESGLAMLKLDLRQATRWT